MKKMLSILVASSLLFAFGCQKKEEAVSDTAQARVETIFGDWDKSVVNGLLKYVPADSSMVYASTGAIDLSSPIAKAYFKKADKLVHGITNEMESQFTADYTSFADAYASLIALSINYEVEAPKWGLDAKGKTDFISYFTDTKLVLKLTLVDGEKTKSQMTSLLKGLDVLRLSERKVGDAHWLLIAKKSNDILAIAAHFGAKELTVGLVFDVNQDIDYLNDLLKPAKKQMHKDTLGKLKKGSFGVGFIDSSKLLTQALNPSTDVGKMLILDRIDLSLDTCPSELQGIAKTFPRLEFESICTENEIYLNSTLKISKRESIADLKSMRGKELEIATSTSILSLFLSFDVGQSLIVLTKWGKAIEQAPYRCKSLDFINKVGTTLAGLPILAAGEQFKFLFSLTGLGVSLESYKAVENVPHIAASGYISGSSLADAAKFVKSILGNDIESLSNLDLSKDVVSTVDLSDVVGLPLLLQTQFTDTGLIMVTGEGVDMGRISKLEAKTGQSFIKLTLDHKTDLFGAKFNLDLMQSYNIGVTDDGLTSSSVLIF